MLPIISDDDHVEDGHSSADGAGEAVEFAAEGSPSPVPLHEDVDGHRGPHRGHHEQVGYGQVHHEHVGLQRWTI